MIVDVSRLIRVEQWTKNLIVFFPAFFAGELFYRTTLINTIQAFIAFCFIASGIYIINDYIDIEKDKNHPVKKNRPLASGKIPKKLALFLLAIFIFISFAISIYLLSNFLISELILLYFIINIAYSFYLKNIALVDITCIASGFLIRVFVGGFAANVPISNWLVLITFLLSMSIALGKRRDDLVIDVENEKLRKSLSGYSLEFVNISLVVMAVISIVCYIMYCVSHDVVTRMHSDKIYITAFPVIMGVLRYLQLVLVYNNSGSPTKILLKDRFIQAIILVWLLIFAYFLYAHT